MLLHYVIQSDKIGFQIKHSFMYKHKILNWTDKSKCWFIVAELQTCISHDDFKVQTQLHWDGNW